MYTLHAIVLQMETSTKSPCILHMHAFGCAAYALMPNAQRKKT